MSLFQDDKQDDECELRSPRHSVAALSEIQPIFGLLYLCRLATSKRYITLLLCGVKLFKLLKIFQLLCGNYVIRKYLNAFLSFEKLFVIRNYRLEIKLWWVQQGRGSCHDQIVIGKPHNN